MKRVVTRGDEYSTFKMASLETTNSSDLLQYISENIIGKDLTFQSPFGVRKG